MIQHRLPNVFDSGSAKHIAFKIFSLISTPWLDGGLMDHGMAYSTVHGVDNIYCLVFGLKIGHYSSIL